jgi:hypothetical protein
MMERMEMTTRLFSVNATSETLEVDRRTITKALRRVKPDGEERGQDRWRLATILKALDALPGSTGSPTQRRTSNVTSDEELAAQIFAVTECFTRASDAIVALEEMPEHLRQAESKHVMAKMEAFRSACEAANPGGLPQALRDVLAEMFRALLYACHLVICEDDGVTPVCTENLI